MHVTRLHVPLGCVGRRRLGWCALVLAAVSCGPAGRAQEPAGSPESILRGNVIAAAGGDGALLTLFRMHERYNAGKERAVPGTARVSVVAPPESWWIGTAERGAEPAKTVAWAWTLGVLRDARSRLAVLPDVTDDGRPLAGLRVTGSVEPALDMYFDKATHELVRVDWRNDIYRFSEWQTSPDGARYPARCAMFRRNSGDPWFFHEIVSIERLAELPAGLGR